MMTEDLSGDCLNIPACWRFLHRPLFQSPSTSHSAVHLFSKQGRVLTCGVWVSLWGGKQDWQRGDSWPTPAPQTLFIVLSDMVPVVLLPELSTNGSFGVILCPHQTLSALPALSCASPYTERKSPIPSRDGVTDLSASETANIDQPLWKGALLIYPKWVHPPWKIRADKEAFTELGRMLVGTKAW